MTRPVRLLALGALALGLVVAALPVTGAAGADRPDPVTTARRHLASDASGALQVTDDRSGRVRFVATRTGAGVINPDVAHGATVAQAARAHLDRYGAALGATRDTEFVHRTTTRATSGVDVVTYAQEVGGVPVIGGDVVVSMAPDRRLRSLLSTVSSAATVAPATVGQDAAATTALGLVARDGRPSGLQVTPAGRWLLDPEVVAISLPTGPRTVWRFEVGDGAGVRQLVLVDDHTGQVLLRSDLIERADPDRVVCDRAQIPGSDTSCTLGFARTETSLPSLVADVNSAFDLSGAVSAFYSDVAHVSLTQLLGVTVLGVRKLASTVRFCPSVSECPYANAFWNGRQMFYGTGWANADDVVGHEMTHGFIDQYSRLFYWGQSGAINESMADVIGEIIDHRDGLGTDAPGNWDLGEDLPAPYGTIRSLSNPLLYGQPDRMTSTRYTADAGYTDSGGVHTNSGVGNKTAYLISQGGSFNGQSITGIDGADPSLTKTAQLYVDVIERLSSGADYAALAQQLDQSCQDLQGTAGFTVADCTAVHQAGLATELTSAPANAPTTAPADTTCPSGTAKRVLFDSEAGNPAAAFTPTTGAPTGWRRGSGTFVDDSWFADDPPSTSANSLALGTAVPLPAGQPSYLSFRGWWVLDFVASGTDAGYYDGGTVELSVDGGPMVTAGSGWTNGPSRVLTTKWSNPWGGTTAFAGDSRGWIASRLDLGAYAGSTVRPAFTLRADSSVGFYGWALDDITVYTCDLAAPPPPPPPPATPATPSAPQAVVARGSLDGMTVSWTAPAVNPAAVTAYQVSVGGSSARMVPASTTSLAVGGLPSSTSIFSVTVQALGAPGSAAAGTTIAVPRGYASIRARRHGARLTVKGSVSAAGSAIVAALVQVQRHTPSGWRTVRTVATRSDGSYATAVRRPQRAYYRAVFAGSAGVVGTTSGRHRW